MDKLKGKWQISEKLFDIAPFNGRIPLEQNSSTIEFNSRAFIFYSQILCYSMKPILLIFKHISRYVSMADLSGQGGYFPDADRAIAR